MQVKKILLFSKKQQDLSGKTTGDFKKQQVFQCKQQVLWEAYVLRFSQMPHYDCHFMLQKAVAEFVVARFVQFFL
mgnify:CR=1 FL=1